MTDAPPEGRITTHVDGHVLTIAIDRPRKLNGFTPEMVLQLARAYTAYEEDEALWCAVLCAEGSCFTAGLQLFGGRITGREAGRFEAQREEADGTGRGDCYAAAEPIRRRALVAREGVSAEAMETKKEVEERRREPSEQDEAEVEKQDWIRPGLEFGIVTRRIA